MAKKQRSSVKVEVSGSREVVVSRMSFLSAGFFGAYMAAAAWAVSIIYALFAVSVSAYGRGMGMMMGSMYMTPSYVVSSFVALVALGFVWGLVVAVFYNAFARFGALRLWLD
ncbi:hypothetical protein HY640_03035 [Candidatus Woesearchaeota archaeon]|nr:hypothetical protein [Candidatus Woesearchaeota archaeon]